MPISPFRSIKSRLILAISLITFIFMTSTYTLFANFINNLVKQHILTTLQHSTNDISNHIDEENQAIQSAIDEIVKVLESDSTEITPKRVNSLITKRPFQAQRGTLDIIAINTKTMPHTIDYNSTSTNRTGHFISPKGEWTLYGHSPIIKKHIIYAEVPQNRAIFEHLKEENSNIRGLALFKANKPILVEADKGWGHFPTPVPKELVEQKAYNSIIVPLPITIFDEQYTLQLEIDTKATREDVEALSRTFIVISLLFWLLAILGATLLIHRYLSPLQKVSAEAKDIALRTTGKELTSDHSHNEITEIVSLISQAFDIVSEYHEEKMKAEERLMRNIEATESVMLNLPVGIIITNSNNIIIKANDTAIRMIGSKEEDIVNHNCSQFFSNSSQDHDVINRRMMAACYETEIITDIGNLPILKSVDLIKMNNEKVLLETFVDITDLKHKEEELRKEKERADQNALNAEKSSKAKSLFLTNISHEIRTPMNGILGMTELLLDSHLSDAQQEKLGIIRRSGTHMLNILNGILDYSKLKTGTLEIENINFDLHTSIEDIVDTLRLKVFEKGLRMEFMIAPNVPSFVYGDPHRIRQILFNLISNAVKFTSEGTVTLKVDLDGEHNNEVTIRFTVIDTGIGIPHEFREHIFDSFEQADISAKRSYGGVGLGLSIAQKLVLLMGGDIDYNSTEGEGTEFWFTVKLIKQIQHHELTKEIVDISGQHILLADDSEINIEYITGLLSKWNCTYEVSRSKEDFESHLKNSLKDKRLFDIIFIEKPLHGGGVGKTLIRMVKDSDEFSHIPIIVLSSDPRRGDAKEVASLGVHSFLPVPVKQQDLQESIEIIVGRIKRGTTHAPLITRHSLAEERKRRISILVVDDNKINRTVAKALLEKLGYRVMIAVDGKEALTMLQNNHFDLIFMDLQMPIMDGYEATKQIRSGQNSSDIPIVALTANALEEDQHYCLEIGMNDYITKPLQPERAQQVILDLT